MITQAVVDQCGLQPIGTTTVSLAMHDIPDAEVFLVNIYLPNQVAIPALRVIKLAPKSGDVLIGMDIISSGDFALTHPGRKTKFSFRVPSQANIDFVAETNRANLLSRQSPPSKQTRERKRRERKRKP